MSPSAPPAPERAGSVPHSACFEPVSSTAVYTAVDASFAPTISPTVATTAPDAESIALTASASAVASAVAADCLISSVDATITAAAILHRRRIVCGYVVLLLVGRLCLPPRVSARRPRRATPPLNAIATVPPALASSGAPAGGAQDGRWRVCHRRRFRAAVRSRQV